MSPAIDELSMAVLKKSLQHCSMEELERLARDHPYFGPVQLLLAKKISLEHNDNAPSYKEQVQKASLYFTNRLWLDLLLNEPGNDNNGVIDTSVAKEDAPMTEQQDSTVETMGTSMTPTFNAELPGEEIKEQEYPRETDLPVNSNITENHAKEEAAAPVEMNTTAIEQPAIEPVKPGPGDDKKELLFEPYHTVDYFASQGIRFREEDKPKDRLGVQLKSFTEWLKTLKRVPPEEIAAASDPHTERKVEQMAEYSIAERHVITEAMAEVWQKQGNKSKAEEIYRKLSLLDPSKTAYFAAKIEELKKTS